jgi:hypothetical protein
MIDERTLNATIGQSHMGPAFLLPLFGPSMLLALTLGCAAAPVQPSRLPVGQPFELRLGATAMLDGDLFVTFNEVRSDSRCPMDAICVQAGEASVGVVVADQRDGSLARADGVLGTTPGTSTTAIGEYSVRLVQIEPYPQAARPITPADYVITLVVSPR